jgi:hypothetical protein
MVQRRQVSSPAVAQQFNPASGLRRHRDFSARDEAAAGIWRWCSAVATLCQLPFAIFNFTTVRKFSAVEFKGVNKVLFFPLFAVGIATILLQLYNVAVWNWFWPFFAGIVVHLIAAMLQFMRLVLLPRPNEPPGEGA